MILASIQENILYGFILFILILGFSQSAFAQSGSRESGKETLFQVSLVPGLSTSDSYSTSLISFNILGGYNGAFHGFELGKIFNGNRYDVSGLQLSAGANWNEQQSRGVVFSGVVNLTQTFDRGILASGGVNISRKETKGVLISGVLNISGGFSKGFMAAGGINLADDANGLLIAGGLNIATGKFRGTSIAPLNIARQHAGVQVGILNVSGSQEGTQIGIINIAGEGEGTPIGLLSFVKSGRFNVNLWGSETGFVNGGFRLGTERVYNVIGIGYNPFHEDKLWQTAVGIGYYQPLEMNGSGFETDLIYYNVNHDGLWSTDTSSHIQWRFHYTRVFTEGVGLFTGPSLNLYLTNESQSDSHIPYTIYDHTSGNNRLHWWIGWSLGIELF